MAFNVTRVELSHGCCIIESLSLPHMEKPLDFKHCRKTAFRIDP